MASPPLTLGADVLALIQAQGLQVVPAAAPADAVDDRPFEQYQRRDGSTIYHRAVSLGDTQQRTLFAHHVWNGARAAARWLDEHAETAVRDLRVLELGAGSGLPSLVAISCSARFTMITDYPYPELVRTMQGNLDRNGFAERCAVAGYNWGTDASALVGGGAYECVVLADCLWNHEKHEALVASVLATLARSAEARALVTFSHHIPGEASKAKDLNFFALARQHGLEGEHVETYSYAPIMEEPGVDSQEVFVWTLRWSAA